MKKPRTAEKPVARHLQLGFDGELMAERFLIARGMKILDRRVRYRRGELDLVAKDGDEWVFVEVKTRKSGSHGTAAEAFTPEKLRRMRRAVEMYVYEHNLADAPVRGDCIAIDFEPGGTPEISYFPGELMW